MWRGSIRQREQPVQKNRGFERLEWFTWREESSLVVTRIQGVPGVGIGMRKTVKES